MAEQDWNTGKENAGENRRTAKKIYQEPAFRHERVFETMALSCGKVNANEFQCKFNRHTS
jgi:hypothetical protein